MPPHSVEIKVGAGGGGGLEDTGRLKQLGSHLEDRERALACRTQGPGVSPTPDKHLLFQPRFGFSFTSGPLPPQRPHARPCGPRCSACYCTLSNTCWQLPGITPERGRCSSPARGAGVWAKPLRSGRLYFYPEHQQGQLLLRAALDFSPLLAAKEFSEGGEREGGGESLFSECSWESLNPALGARVGSRAGVRDQRGDPREGGGAGRGARGALTPHELSPSPAWSWVRPASALARWPAATAFST